MGSPDDTRFTAMRDATGEAHQAIGHHSAATILGPFVREKNRWVVEQHAIFQGYYPLEAEAATKSVAEPQRGAQ